MEIQPRRFESPEEMSAALAGLLAAHIQAVHPGCHAVMLSGGRTPQAAYRHLVLHPVPADPLLHLFLSDERMVAPDSPDSNYGNAAAMIRAVGVAPGRVMRVQTELAVETAAEVFHEELKGFFARAGRITLGLLGLGADGHTASLFTARDIERGAGRYAVAVARSPGPDRVSVTRDLLLRIERIVFVAVGQEKSAVVERLLSDPLSLTAGKAVEGADNVEVWIV